MPVASFASSILSNKDHPSLVIGALQLVDLLLTKLPTQYKPTFRREGVFHEIEVLAERPLVSAKSKDKDKDKEPSETSFSEPVGIASAPPISGMFIPGYKKLTSLALEPEDAITLRARVIQFRHLTRDNDAESDNAFESLRLLVARISNTNATERELSEALRELAELFSSPHTSVSSFELLQSGIVDGLLQFAADKGHARESWLIIDLIFRLILSNVQSVLRGAKRCYWKPSVVAE